MDSPRRSARLARHQQPAQTSFNQYPTAPSRFASTSTASYPSLDKDMNNPPLHQSQSQSSLQLPSQLRMSIPPANNPFNAPLPSPSTMEYNPFFGRPHSQPNMIASTLHGTHSGFGMSQPQHQQQQVQQCGQQERMANQQQILQTNQGPFPPDFDVLAEAAKRAQVACLVRDLDDVSL